MSDDFETITRIVKENRTKTTFTIEVEHAGEELKFDDLFYSSGYYKPKWKASTIKTKTEEIDVEVKETRSISHKKVENKIAKKIVFDTLKKAGYPRLKTNQTTPDDGVYCRINCTWAKSWRNRTSDCIFNVILLPQPRINHHSAKQFRIFSEDNALKIQWDYASFAPNYDWQNRQEYIHTEVIPFADPDLAEKLEAGIKKLSKAMIYADACWRNKWGTGNRRYGRSELEIDQYKEMLRMLKNEQSGAENSS